MLVSYHRRCKINRPWFLTRTDKCRAWQNEDRFYELTEYDLSCTGLGSVTLQCNTLLSFITVTWSLRPTTTTTVTFQANKNVIFHKYLSELRTLFMDRKCMYLSFCSLIPYRNHRHLTQWIITGVIKQHWVTDTWWRGQIITDTNTSGCLNTSVVWPQTK